jgi:hypothetical protein
MNAKTTYDTESTIRYNRSMADDAASVMSANPVAGSSKNTFRTA